MGLEIVVGFLSKLRREGDMDIYADVAQEFERLNRYLQSRGLPPHHEPEDCETWSVEMPGYHGLHYLRRIAAHLDLKGKLPTPGTPRRVEQDVALNAYYNGLAMPVRFGFRFSFNHLINHSDAEGYYLPQDFGDVLSPPEEAGVWGGWVGSSVALLRECERLAEALEIPPELDETSSALIKAMHGPKKNVARWQQYGMESFVCVALMQACRKSIATGAAIMFL